MELRVRKLTPTFLRMVLFLVLVVIFFTPLTPAFAQLGFGTSIPPVNTSGSGNLSFPNIGNNPGNPNAPGYFGGTGSSPDYSLGTPVDPNAPNTAVQDATGYNTGTPASAATDNAKALIDYNNNLQDEKTYGVLISIGGWIAGLGGNAFEIAVNNFALKLGCYFVQNGNCAGALVSNGAVGGVVNELWTFIRDLFNLALIFSLIFLGFKIILNSDDSGTRKALGYLIAAALMVNFSLYIAKLVVDIANFTTTQIYSTMIQATGQDFSISDKTSEGEDAVGGFTIFSSGAGSKIASSFMTVLQIPSLFSTTAGNTVSFAVLAMFFLVFLGAMFLYGAIMLTARFIAIVILLIFSPIMFLGWVLPNFKGMSDTWRKNFIGYCFYAPVYIFFLYMSLYTLAQMTPKGAQGYGDAFGGNAASANSMSIFVFFFVGAGFLFASTKVAGYMSRIGGVAISKTAQDWARGAAGFAITAPIGLGGRGLTNISDSIERKTGSSNMLTRGLNYTGTKMKDQKILGTSATQKVNATNKWFKDTKESGDKRARGLRDDAAKEKKQGDAIDTLNDDKKSADHERTIAGLSSSAVVAMAKDGAGAAALERRAAYIRPEQMKAIEDDKDMDKAVIKSIKDARTNAIKKKYEKTDDTPAKSEIGKAPVHELALFDISDLENENMAISLSEDKIDKLPEPKFIESDKTRLKDARKNALIKVAYNGGVIKTRDGKTITKNDLLKAKPADIAKYPTEALEALGHELPIPALSKMVQDGSVSKGDQLKIRQVIEKYIKDSNKDSEGKLTDQAAIAFSDWFNGALGKQFGK